MLTLQQAVQDRYHESMCGRGTRRVAGSRGVAGAPMAPGDHRRTACGHAVGLLLMVIFVYSTDIVVAQTSGDSDLFRLMMSADFMICSALPSESTSIFPQLMDRSTSPESRPIAMIFGPCCPLEGSCPPGLPPCPPPGQPCCPLEGSCPPGLLPCPPPGQPCCPLEGSCPPELPPCTDTFRVGTVLCIATDYDFQLPPAWLN